MPTPKPFLQQKGNFRDLIVFRKTECIYDLTFYFAHKFLRKGDRTIDQMIQAARSGKQNIAEGSAAGTTSAETEIKLMNVAKASLQELLLDYEDFLRVRGLAKWGLDDPRYIQTRKACIKHNDSTFFMNRIDDRSAEAIANITITLINQADAMLYNLINTLQKKFLENGGIKEQMYNARIDYRTRR